MRIERLKKTNVDRIKEAVNLVKNEFIVGNVDDIRNHIISFLDRDKITLIAIEDNKVIGIAYAKPTNGIVDWEIYPILINEEYRKQGIGSSLMGNMEKQILKRGGVNINLGKCKYENSDSSKIEIDSSLDENIKYANVDIDTLEFYRKNGFGIIENITEVNGIKKNTVVFGKKFN